MHDLALVTCCTSMSSGRPPDPAYVDSRPDPKPCAGGTSWRSTIWSGAG